MEFAVNERTNEWMNCPSLTCSGAVDDSQLTEDSTARKQRFLIQSFSRQLASVSQRFAIAQLECSLKYTAGLWAGLNRWWNHSAPSRPGGNVPTPEKPCAACACFTPASLDEMQTPGALCLPHLCRTQDPSPDAVVLCGCTVAVWWKHPYLLKLTPGVNPKRKLGMGCSLIHLGKHKQALAAKGVKSEEGQEHSIRVPDSWLRNFAGCGSGYQVKGTAGELWGYSWGGDRSQWRMWQDLKLPILCICLPGCSTLLLKLLVCDLKYAISY